MIYAIFLRSGVNLTLRGTTHPTTSYNMGFAKCARRLILSVVDIKRTSQIPLPLASINRQHIMRITIVVVFLISMIGNSCKRTNQQGWNDLPEVTNISKLQRTEFVTTLECPINDNKFDKK